MLEFNCKYRYLHCVQTFAAQNRHNIDYFQHLLSSTKKVFIWEAHVGKRLCKKTILINFNLLFGFKQNNFPLPIISSNLLRD